MIGTALHRCGRALVTLALMAGLAGGARAQDDGLEEESELVESEATRRFRELTDPEAKAKAEEEKLKPPFEFYRTQVAPFDVLTYVKPNHWVALTQELQANHADYEGMLRTAPVNLRDMPRAVVFRRDARLVEGEAMRLSWPAFLPHRARSLDIELIRPGSIRPDDTTEAPMLGMLPHQMLVVVLAEDPNAYDYWKRYQAFIPATTERGDQQAVDRRSYYRLVIPQDPDEPNLSAHPLTWTSISHVVWDGFDPADLDVGQQRAMVDWLHWGGQLIIAGGSSQSQAILADPESFLAPYMPGEPSPEGQTLDESDLESLSTLFPPPNWKVDLIDRATGDFSSPFLGPRGPVVPGGTRYAAPDPINLPPDRPLLLSGLAPLAPDATWVTDDQGHRLGLERRVGRGRILMLAFDPNEAAFQRWKGNDTFVRRVLLRRPEDPWDPTRMDDVSMLAGPDLSWYRLLGRDLEAPSAPSPATSDPFNAFDPFRRRGLPGLDDPTPEAPVAAWLDSARLPSLSAAALAEASGIEIPGAPFVLRVILAYVVALVPLNWLVCRFVLRRRELAWAVVPLLALGFAVAVERAAAIDMGYDRACDEIDVLELQAGYPRGHLSRFNVLYSTGREDFTIAFPGEPSALALPLNANLNIRGEQLTESTFQLTPVPALVGFRVEPRSLAMFRAEQMLDLRGGILLQSPADGPRAVVNQSELDLRDAILVDVGPPGEGNRYTPLGAIPAGGSVPLPRGDASFAEVPADFAADRPDWVDLEDFIGPLCSYSWGRPEDAGELRLVAWADAPMPGQELEPAVDRHRGFTLVVAHLRYGPPPSPFGERYTSYQPDRLGASDAGRAEPEHDRR